MLGIPINKGDTYEVYDSHPLALIHFMLQFKPTIWALSYPREHTNSTIPLQERHFPTPLRHCRKTAVVL